MPRLELTHDVLTEVIKKSRDERKAREAALEAENRAAQADREIRVKDMELRRAKRRNCQLKCVCFLALICLMASIWQWWEANTAKQMAMAAKQKIRVSNDSADVLIDFILSDLQGNSAVLGGFRCWTTQRTKHCLYWKRRSATKAE